MPKNQKNASVRKKRPRKKRSAPRYTLRVVGSSILLSATNQDPIGYEAHIKFSFTHTDYGQTTTETVDTYAVSPPKSTDYVIYSRYTTNAMLKINEDVNVTWRALQPNQVQPSPNTSDHVPKGSRQEKVDIVYGSLAGAPYHGGAYFKLVCANEEVVRGNATIKVPAGFKPVSAVSPGADVSTDVYNVKMQAYSYENDFIGDFDSFGMTYKAYWDDKGKAIVFSYSTTKKFGGVIAELFVKIYGVVDLI